MIQPTQNQALDIMGRIQNSASSSRGTGFAKVLGATARSTDPALGDPNLQEWLDAYCSRLSGVTETVSPASYEAASGAPNPYGADSVYGPDEIYNRAMSNIVGNAFASMSGKDAATLTAQLPGVPSEQAQQRFDKILAGENMARLENGDAIDTSAYWSDPGSVTLNGKTYTAVDLGYAGPAQSSGPQSIFLDKSDRLEGTDQYMVPGFTGTVTGLTPNHYYTLAELEQAGLPKGQENLQFQPGSWSETAS